MNVRELIEALEGLDPQTEVRIAQQPRWPFEYSIDEVVYIDPSESQRIVTRAEFDEMDEDAQEQIMHDADEDRVLLIDEGQEVPEPIVYIGEGSQLGYLPAGVSRELGWK